MHLKALTLAAAIAAGAALAPLPASANALPAAKAPQSVITDSSMVQEVGRRCWFWRNECASRWGWGGWRFRRCLIRHGC
jgi:hypothetical protein